MTEASHELALTEINNGDRYQRRCRAARYPAGEAAECFTHYAVLAAREYTAQFGSEPGDGIFTAEDILLCAVELEEYYRRHVAEIDALTQGSN